MLELFEQDIRDADLTELYFEDPFELIHIFETMETQNLNALIHLESLAAPMADMTMTITATEIQIKQEIDEITSTISDLEVRQSKFNYLLKNIYKNVSTRLRRIFLNTVIFQKYVKSLYI